MSAMRLGRSNSVRVGSPSETSPRETFPRQKSLSGTPNGARRQKQNENVPPNASPTSRRALPFFELSPSPLLEKSSSKPAKANGSATMPYAGSPGLPPRPPLPKPSPTPSHTPTKGLMNAAQTQNSQDPVGFAKRKLRWESGLADNLQSNSTADTSGADNGVKVVVRVRPLSKREEEEEETSILQQMSNCSMMLADQHFTFDSLAGMESTQQSIFEMVGTPMVENCLSGFNSSIFAYGQTGSGKTYTMWGGIQHPVTGILPNEERGLTPRIFEKLLKRMEEEEQKYAEKQLRYQCRCSFLEIYNEQITDLLDPSQRNLQIREDVKVGVYVENLTEEYVAKAEDAVNLLIKGLGNRRIGATTMNNESSRSHCVFTCAIDCRFKSLSDGMSSVRSSRINLVDLAGSERQRRTGAAGERLKEASSINRSLSQLGNLINILAEVAQTGKQRHIPYRDSKLTFLLQDSLGGNAKLAMICAISPASGCKSETMSTLRFAQRAKAIQNKAIINEETTTDTNLLREQIRQLKDELMRMKSMDNQQPGSGAYSNGWNARRSYNLLRFSLNCPMTLPTVDSDTDEEMEIEEDTLEGHLARPESTPMNDNTNVQSPSIPEEIIKSEVAVGVSDTEVTVLSNIICGEDYVNMKTGNLEAASEVLSFDRRNVLSLSRLDSMGEVPECPQLDTDASEHVKNLESPTFCASPRVRESINKSSSFTAEAFSLQAWACNVPLPNESIELAATQDEDRTDNSDDSDVIVKLDAPTPSISPELTENKKRGSVSTFPYVIEGISPSLAHYPVRKSQGPGGNSVIPINMQTACISSRNLVQAYTSKIISSPTDRLAASLHRGLEIIESHQRASVTALRRSSTTFSFHTQERKSTRLVDRSVQTSPIKLLDTSTSPIRVSEIASDSDGKFRAENAQMSSSPSAVDRSDWQLVAVSEPKTPTRTSACYASESLNQAIEAVLAGAIRRECAAEEALTKKEAELEQANRLIRQYKHERECNVIIQMSQENKISRLESLMDGIIPTDSFLNEEWSSLLNEHKVLQEKYEHHPEVTQAQIDQQLLYDELQKYRDFFDLGEKEVLQEEIVHLRTQLQAFLDSDTPRSTKQRRKSLTPKSKNSLLRISEDNDSLALCTVPKEAKKTSEELAMVVADNLYSSKLEEERTLWAEKEAEWMSVMEELREECECNKQVAEKNKEELKNEKRCSEELREALELAMTGHAKLLEQYADLQEKHIAVLAKHRKIRDGIADVKRMAAKAGLSTVQSKWLEAQAAQIVALNLEREQERQAADEEIECLRSQLRDTAEAVQAAGELLVRLKEAEESVTMAQDSAAISEQEADGLRREMEKLKRRHATEVATLQQRLLEARLRRSAVCPMCVMAERVKFQFVEGDPEDDEAAASHEFIHAKTSLTPTGGTAIFQSSGGSQLGSSPDGVPDGLDEDSCNL